MLTAAKSQLKLQEKNRLDSHHVLHAVLSLDLGGLERLVIDLARLGMQRGQRVTICCVEHEGRLAQHARELGADVRCLNKPAGRSANALLDAEILLRELRPDVVHTHQIGAAWYLGQAARKVGVARVVHTEHSDHVTQAKTWPKKLRARALWWRSAKFVDRFCCVSQDVSNSVRRWGIVPAHKVAVVLNGIDVDRYGDRTSADNLRQSLGIPRQALVVGTVGRLVEVKRQDLLVQALAGLRRAIGDVRLLLVGDGIERDSLERLAVELGVADYTSFVGYQSEPERFFAAMDVFALTSRHEGLPLSLLEAWASRLPVVCSAVGGMADVIENGVDGMLVPSGDVEALTDALLRTLRSKELCSGLGEAGRKKVCNRFSLERMADEYAQHYALAERR